MMSTLYTQTEKSYGPDIYPRESTEMTSTTCTKVPRINNVRYVCILYIQNESVIYAERYDDQKMIIARHFDRQ